MEVKNDNSTLLMRALMENNVYQSAVFHRGADTVKIPERSSRYGKMLEKARYSHGGAGIMDIPVVLHFIIPNEVIYHPVDVGFDIFVTVMSPTLTIIRRVQW